MRAAWIASRAAACEAAEAEKQSHLAVAMLFDMYQALEPGERLVIDRLLADDLSSDSEPLRFLALALLQEFGISSALEDLRSLALKLETATGPGAPYEWAKVNRIVAQLSVR